MYGGHFVHRVYNFHALVPALHHGCTRHEEGKDDLLDLMIFGTLTFNP